MKNKILLSIWTIVIICFNSQLFSQSSSGSNTQVSTSQYLGWDGNPPPNPLNILTQQAQPINFYTNAGATFPWANQRMNISGTTGFVGIANPAPAFLLDVNGDMNLTTATNSFRIGANRVLWNGGNINNIFVGVNAGNAGIGAAANGTFVGFRSGIVNTTAGRRNTFVGYRTGMVNTIGEENTFVGYQTGFANVGTATEGRFNTFVGSQSGMNNTSFQNTFVGQLSGFNNTTGNRNTYLGAQTDRGPGAAPSVANLNTFIGFDAGLNLTSGNENTITGALAAQAITSGFQNVISGVRAAEDITTASGNVILGHDAALSITTGSHNVCVGWQSGAGLTAVGLTDGDNNVFSGFRSGLSQNGNNNTFAGVFYQQTN